jgi:hypothetical protein
VTKNGTFYSLSKTGRWNYNYRNKKNASKEILKQDKIPKQLPKKPQKKNEDDTEEEDTEEADTDEKKQTSTKKKTPKNST